MTQVDLELLTDPDMYLFIEKGLKGDGISMSSSRYGRAKKPYVVGYDKDQERNYMMYLDINNVITVTRRRAFLVDRGQNRRFRYIKHHL